MYRGLNEIRVENSKGIAYISSDAIRTLKHFLFSPEIRSLRNKFHHFRKITEINSTTKIGISTVSHFSVTV